MHRLARFLPFLGVLLVVVRTAPAQPRALVQAPLSTGVLAVAGPREERLIGLLRGWLIDAPAGGPEKLFRSLRKLRDPALRPLFSDFATSTPAVLRRNGILGLAELEPERRVDTLLVRRIPAATEQAAVLAEAFRQGLLSVDQLEDIARWPDLDPLLETLVLGRLVREGRPVERARLVARLADQATAPAVFSACLLTHLGGAEAAQGTATLDARVFGLPAADRRVAQGTVLQYLREERLAGCAAVARRIYDGAADDPLLRFDTILTLLIIAPDDPGTPVAFEHAFAGNPGLAEHVRLGLAVLEAALEVPVGTRGLDAPIRTVSGAPEPLVATMGAGVQALRADTDFAGAGVALVDTAHAPSIAWALRAVDRRPTAEGVRVRSAVIERIPARARTQADLWELVMASATGLADSAPGELARHLEHAAGAPDPRVLETLLAGVLRSANAGSVPLPSPSRWPSDLSEGLALLVRARGAGSGTPELTDALASVALGKGALPEVFRVQAAWLALRLGGHERVALARILGGLDKN